MKLKRRLDIARVYRNELRNVPGLKLLDYKDDRKCAYWLFTMLVEHRVDFIEKLRDDGIPASVMHQRIDNNSVFGGIRPDLVNQEKFNEKQVSIPVHSELTDGDVELVVNAIKKGW
jgi:perosamine synthetase